MSYRGFDDAQCGLWCGKERKNRKAKKRKEKKRKEMKRKENKRN